MPAIGYQELFVILIVLAFLFEAMRLRGTGTVLVLSEFRVNSDPQAEELLYIRGRAAGPLSWFFTQIGLMSGSTLRVTRSELTLDRASLNGFSAHYMPLSRAGIAHCFYYRAFAFLVLSLLCQLAGLAVFLRVFFTTNDYERQAGYSTTYLTLIGAVVLSAIFYLIYSLSKRIVIQVNCSGGQIGIAFKRSVIENVTVELAQALEAADLLNGQILARTSPKEF
jgi:hypothetical protein